MATDFYERQAAARRNTTRLVVMFALAVAAIIITTFVATAAAIHYTRDFDPRTTWEPEAVERFPWEVPVWAAVGALVLIGGGSMFKIAQLAGGGTVVAERLGGRRIYPNTTDRSERRVLNVVEEMALASGVPVPPVFLLANEEGVNAFAAGFSPSDAVIGVTRGCVEQLSRDELQGVIAHEFSHILNGDMRLNLRLIGVVHGILLLGLIGRELLYWAGHGSYRSRRNSGIVYFLVIGLAMMVLGFLGTFLGNLIKAAISRQREFLADASAVQFTRNPGGIAGALKRIGAAVFGSRVRNPHAAEASHMFFSQGVWAGLSGLMATHPPLPERIRRLDPQWDGQFPPAPKRAAAVRAEPAAAGFVGAAALAGAGERVPSQAVGHAAEQVACPTQVHRQYVAELLAAMPPALVEAAHEPYGARALIYAILLDRDADVRAVQLRALEQNADPNVFEQTLRLAGAVQQLDVRARLPLVDMTLPALRALTPPQYQTFAKCFATLVDADQRVGLFEWALHQVLMRHLRPQFQPVQPPQILYYGLQRLAGPCSVLLSTLARASEGDTRRAFDSGAQHIADVAVRLLPPEECTLSRLNDALGQLSQVAIKQRQRLVDACAACVCSDGDVRVAEAELLRAICDMLEFPMPPLLPGQQVAPLEFPAHEPSRA